MTATNRSSTRLLSPNVRFVGFVSVLVAASALLLAFGPKGPPEVSDYVYRVRIHDCRITTPQVATAFRISDDLLVSVAHPFEDIVSFHLDGPDGDLHADVVGLRPLKDLAILRLREPIDADPGLLRSEEIPKNRPVEIPTFDNRGELTVDDGHALRRAWVTVEGEGRRRSIELQAEIVAGDSGAPVLFEDRIVGAVFATTRGKDKGWAISLPEITALLDELPVDPQPLPLGCAAE